MLQCGKPGPILVPNTYAHKTSLRTSICIDKLQKKSVSGSEEEYFLFLHFSNIFPGHYYTSCTPFALHQHSRTYLHSSNPLHCADPSPKSPNLLIASKSSLFTPIPCSVPPSLHVLKRPDSTQEASRKPPSFILLTSQGVVMPVLPFANKLALSDHLYWPAVMPQTSLITISIPPKTSYQISAGDWITLVPYAWYKTRHSICCN